MKRINIIFAFKVEKIINHRTFRGKKQFKIRWLNYSSNEDTWEPENELRENPNIAKMLDEYMETMQTLLKDKVGEIKKIVTKVRNLTRKHTLFILDFYIVK